MWRYRLRRLFRVPALPGWLGLLWWLIEKASTVAWLKDIWVAARPRMPEVIAYSSMAAILGIGWLVYRVVRRPRVIDLLEIVRGQGSLIIKDAIIKGRVIEGPAMVFLDGLTTIENCVFHGTSYAVIDDATPRLYGAIGLLDCKIFDSEFHNIGFVGTAAQIATIRAGIKGGPVALPGTNH